MLLRTIVIALVVGFASQPLMAAAPDSADAEFDRGFKETVRPFLAAYCISCHGGEKPKADLSLSSFSTTAAVIADQPHWVLVLEKLNAKEMPPEESKRQPSVDERHQVIDWIAALRESELKKHAGDPGPVLARRLSNAEYNYTIRDLTGFDLRPTREFPVDPANPAGFDNSGESLAMSPELMNKYLQAARDVADHLVFKPTGLSFAPYPMLVETDRDKYCVEQIIDFYHRHDVDYADYFEAAWRYKHRAALGKPNATLAGLADAAKISPKYLQKVWSLLDETPEEIGPTAHLQTLWRELPPPQADRRDIARKGCEQMRDYIVQLRKKVEPRFPNVAAGKLGATSQPLLMWKNQQYASHRMSFDPKSLQVVGEAPAKPVREETSEPEPGADNEFGPGKTMLVKNKPGDPDLGVPAGQRELYETAFAKFCSVFPDAFYVEERGRNYFDKTKDRGRYLSAGFHNVMGYFRDDQPLYELLLDEAEQKQLDEMWRELDYIAGGCERTYIQFYLNEAGEARNAAKGGTNAQPATLAPEDKDIASDARINRVRQNYLTRAGTNEVAIKAVEDHFKMVNDTLRWVDKAKLAAEPVHLRDLLEIAARAYRRPLTQEERDDLTAFYRSRREKADADHESAIRDCLVYVLMAPDFCYRIDLAGDSPGIHPLSDYALASRLSYFLWSSMPDQELLDHAAAGDLHRPGVLAEQTARMLKDAKVRALAIEFGGNWLDFRRFEELNTVDRERFSSFTNELREAMFEEPVRFLVDVFENNRSILDCLYANHTFVNSILAKHYGMPVPNGGANDWVRIDGADQYGRGGLLAMAAFLTKNAPGLRTSPVKRGYWVVKNVLGERIPPPPAAVPELPRDEAKLDLPLREKLEQHRADLSCAACHSRFDSLGLVFEGYGPIGERRKTDLAGHAVDTNAIFPGGSEGNGFDGLRQYLREHRQQDFINNLCRKLLAYGLNRSLIPSDDPLIEEMRNQLAENEYRFDTLVKCIVTSPQFLNKRGRDEVAKN